MSDTTTETISEATPETAPTEATESTESTEPIIHLDNVSLCYRLAKQRIGSFKEYFIHMVKGSLIYEELWALRDLNIQVHRGEVLGVIGHNGAGKSTLSKVICGILKPTRGQCDVRGGKIAPILELGTGFDYELTGYENIKLNALMLGRKRREIEEKVDYIIEFSGLGDFIHTPVRNYSTGMVARLGFSVATAWVPDILILDEVLAVGDGRFLERCIERMDEVRRAGTTVVLITHNLPEVQNHCTRCIWLHQGRIKAEGQPADIVPQYVEHLHAQGGGLSERETTPE